MKIHIDERCNVSLNEEVIGLLTEEGKVFIAKPPCNLNLLDDEVPAFIKREVRHDRTRTGN